MDCRTCQPTLIDLLYGELATDAAEEAQAHLKQCSSCRSAFDKLAHGMHVAQRMPRLEPPPAVGARLIQLAEEHARASAALRKTSARKPPRAWQSLLDFVGRFAMARQVGMATIMLLIVAVGMWALPQSRRAHVADGGTVVTPEATGETALAPVEEVRPPAGPSVAAPALAPAEGASSEAELDHSATSTAEQRARPDSLARRSTSAGGTASRARREPQAFPESAERAAAPARKAPAADKAAYGRGSRDDDALAGLENAQGDSLALGPQPSAAPQPAAPAPASARAVAAEAESGDRARAESKKAEAPAQAATARCDDARLREYQQTVDAAPSSAAAGRALLSLSRCRRLRGEHALARALLERAARNPHVAEQARALLGASGQPAKPSAPAAATAEPPAADSSP